MGDARHRRTAAGPLLHEIARRFRDGRDTLPPGAWRAWRRTIAFGAAGLFAFMAVLRFSAERILDAGLHDAERKLLARMADLPLIRFSTAVFLQTFGSDITLIILIAFTAGIAAWIRRPIASLGIILAALVPDLVVRFGWMIWSRPRPDILHDGVAAPGFHAFPSGHAAKTFAVYGFLTLLWLGASRSPIERTCAVIAFAFIALAVPIGRVAMGVHWPSDVIGGLAIGFVWVSILGSALRHEHR